MYCSSLLGSREIVEAQKLHIIKWSLKKYESAVCCTALYAIKTGAVKQLKLSSTVSQKHDCRRVKQISHRVPEIGY